MNNSALATVHPLPVAKRPPAPIPSAGLAAVITLPTPLTRAGLMRLAETQGELDLDVDEVAGSRDRPRLQLVGGDGDPDRFATRFAQVLVEVIGGDRGAHQLMRWTTDRVYEDLLRRSSALQRAAANGQRARRPRAQVRSVHLCRPHDEAAELSIHVHQGARSRAIAARIELLAGRWRCTALQFG